MELNVVLKRCNWKTFDIFTAGKVYKVEITKTFVLKNMIPSKLCFPD